MEEYIKIVENARNNLEQAVEKWKHQAGLGSDTTDRLSKQLEQKEQECEELKEKVKKYGEINEQETKDYAELKAENEKLKKIINEATSSSLDLKSFLVGEAVQNEYEQQLDQLKVDRGEALKQLEFVRTLNIVKEAETRKLSKALAEIKEIAEIDIECKTYEIENDCFNETRCKALNEHIDFIKQILQKISECEVENAR